MTNAEEKKRPAGGQGASQGLQSLAAFESVINGAGAPCAVSVLQALRDQREYQAAMDLMERWGDRFDHDADFVRVRRDILGKLGQITESLVLANTLVGHGHITAVSLVTLEGRVKELHGVRPRIQGPHRPVEPISSRCILHLVKESRPYLSNGFTSRSHYNFLAEKAAGLSPVVMTEPGFPRSVVDGQFPTTRQVDGVQHVHLDLGAVDLKGMPVDRYLQLFADMAYSRVREIRPAVIHVSSGRRGFETALVALALREKTGIPVAYEVRSFFESNWTDDVRYEAQGEIYTRRMERELECMRAADMVLTIGETMKRELSSRGIPAEKIGVIPNGVDCERFTPRSRPVELAESLGIGTSPTIGYVSNMDHARESQETLIRATAELKRQGRDEHCVLVGDGSRRAELEALAHSLGVAERVHFVGRVDHGRIMDYYALIDVFVVPRIWERAAIYVTPLKPFEAMAMRLPVVVSNVPALTEIADPPRRGWSFVAGDPESLAQVITGVRSDPAEMARRAQSGFDWVREQRQWKHNGERYRNYFAHLTDVTGAPGERD